MKRQPILNVNKIQIQIVTLLFLLLFWPDTFLEIGWYSRNGKQPSLLTRSNAGQFSNVIIKIICQISLQINLASIC